MRLRNGSWFSTFVVAVFVTVHLLPSEVYWATTVFYETPYARPGTSDPLVRILLIAFFAVELLAVFVVSRIVDWKIASLTRPRWLQLHLSTCVVLMIVASGLVLLHLEIVRIRIGHYTIDYLPVHLLFSTYILICVAVVAEALARRRGSRVNEAEASIALPLLDESTTGETGISERVIYALPMVTLFAFVLVAPLLIDPIAALCRKNRIDLALPTRVVFFCRQMEFAPAIVLSAMACSTAFYVAWASRERQRLFWFNAVVLAVVLMGTLGGIFGLIAPFIIYTIDHL